jgi:hypothetical protein
MTLAPIRREYHDSRLSEAPNDPTSVLEAFDPDEALPDTTLPESRRRKLKRFVEVEALTLTPHELMYLACAFEDAAKRKHALSKFNRTPV